LGEDSLKGESFYYSEGTSPLVNYWDEEEAFKREIYEISYGRAFGMVSMS
jgi:hypothetical protein